MDVGAGCERLLVLAGNVVDAVQERFVEFGVSLEILSADANPLSRTDFLLCVSGTIFTISQAHICIQACLTRRDTAQLDRALERARRDNRGEDLAVLERAAYHARPRWITVCVKGARTMAGGVEILLAAVRYSRMAYPVMADGMDLLKEVDWLDMSRSSQVALLDGFAFAVTALYNLFLRGMSSLAWHVLSMGGLLVLQAILIVVGLAWMFEDQIHASYRRVLGGEEEMIFMSEDASLQNVRAEGEDETNRPATDREIRLLEAAKERNIREINTSSTVSSPPAAMATNSTVATAGESSIDDMDYEPSRPYQACGSTAPATRKRSFDDMVERYDSVLSVAEARSSAGLRPGKNSILNVSINPELRCRATCSNTFTPREGSSYGVKETPGDLPQASSSTPQPPKAPSHPNQTQPLPSSTQKHPATPQPPTSSTPKCSPTPQLKPLAARYKRFRPRQGSPFEPCGPSCVAIPRDLTVEQVRRKYPRLSQAYEELDEDRKARKRELLHVKCSTKGGKKKEEEEEEERDFATDVLPAREGERMRRRLAVSLAGGSERDSDEMEDTATPAGSSLPSTSQPGTTSSSAETEPKRPKHKYLYAPSPDPHTLMLIRRSKRCSRPSTPMPSPPAEQHLWDGSCSSSSSGTAGSGSSGSREEAKRRENGKGKGKARAQIERIEIVDEQGRESGVGKGEGEDEGRRRGVLTIR